MITLTALSCACTHVNSQTVDLPSLTAEQSSKMVFSCSQCAFRCNFRLEFIKHIFSTHSTEPSFHFVCSIQGCPHSFKVGSTFSSFKSHASRKHPNWRQYVNDEASPTVELPELGPTVHQAQSDSDVRDIPTCNSPCSEQCSVYPLTCPPEQKAAALFLLTFQEKYKASQAAVNFAVGAINTILNSVCERVQGSLEVDLASSSDIIRASFDEREDPFAQLQTEYKQSKFYREHFGLVVSIVYLDCHYSML